VIVLSPCLPYAPAFQLETEYGTMAGTHLPPVLAPIPAHALAALHPEERAFAMTRRAYRQVQFVGGRLALGAVVRALGYPSVAVLSDEHGAPTLPAGLTGSVSHKRDLAVAIVAAGDHGLGIDIEDAHRSSLDIASHVLCDDEQHAIAALDEPRRLLELITRFSIKESVYKALHRFVRRHIGFRDVAVWPDEHGGARVDLRLDGAGEFRFTVLHTRLEHQVLSIVQAHPTCTWPDGNPRPAVLLNEV
jgi:enterobactin synthetase component D